VYKAPRGTTDLWGQKLASLRFIEKTARSIFRLYRYGEITTPIFEETALFSRSIGEDTDVVEKEMYTFSDRKGRSLTLRPEGTASIARAVIQHHLYRESGVLKFFYFGPMFRYERPQAGRQRQFYHLGYEAIGSEDPSVDAEVIVMAWQIFQELNLKNISFRINNIGCNKCRPVYRKKLEGYLRDKVKKLCPDCRRRSSGNIFRVLDCKREECRAIIDASPKSIDSLCEACRLRQDKVEGYLKPVSLPYIIDGKLVRGLDYYTGVVFEVRHASLGAQDAVGGGGRYDNLIKNLGGPRVPATGFACGVERLILALEGEGILPPQDYTLNAYVIALGEEEKLKSFGLAMRLRRAGLNIEIGHEKKSLKGELRRAGKLGARFIIIIGEEELKRGEVTVKSMEDGTQVSIPQGEVPGYLKK
jgi:histidyl-tRNA synthetase